MLARPGRIGLTLGHVGGGVANAVGQAGVRSADVDKFILFGRPEHREPLRLRDPRRAWPQLA